MPTTHSSNCPIRLVRLYQQGKGYFEHLAKIESTAHMELCFHQDDMESVLRSIHAVDLDTGCMQAISYSNRPTFAERLKNLTPKSSAIHLSELPDGLKGQKLFVESPDFMKEAVLVGIEEDEFDNQSVLRLKLQTSNGLRRIRLDDITRLEPCDPDIQEQLQQWLSGIASQIGGLSRKLNIFAQGEGPRRILIAYARPMPAWRMTWRLNFEQGQASLQGWALIQNPTAESWQDVSLQLLGNYPRQSQVRLDLAPERVTSRSCGNYFLAPEEVYVHFAPPQEDEDCDLAMKHADGAPDTYDLPRDIQIQAPESQITQRIEYHPESSVSLAAGHSALVQALGPVTVPSTQMLSYCLGGQKPWPMAAVRLENTLPLVLDSGTVAVHENGLYAGEADMCVVGSGESCLLEYRVEERVSIECAYESEIEDHLTEFEMEQGFFSSCWLSRKISKLAICSQLETPMRLNIRYFDPSPSRLVDIPGWSVTRTSQYHFIEGELPAGAHLQLTLVTEAFNQEQASVWRMQERLIEHLILKENGSELLDHFKPAESLSHRIDEFTAHRDRLSVSLSQDQSEREKIFHHSQALNEHTVQQSLLPRYHTLLVEIDERIEKLRNELNDEDDQIIQAKAELDRFLKAIIISERFQAPGLVSGQADSEIGFDLGSEAQL